MKPLHILLFLACCTLWACNDYSQFREQGILVEGSVARKTVSGSRRSRSYHFTVYFFTDPNKENPKPKVPEPDTVKSVDQILDEMSQAIKDIKIGDFTSADIKVSGRVFDAYQEGDKIALYYIKGNPQQVQLQMVVDGKKDDGF